MKIISFFIIFKFVNPVPPSFKREFLNELHTSLLPYQKRLAFYYMRSFERVIALFDLDISSGVKVQTCMTDGPVIDNKSLPERGRHNKI
jgi:hypothetical protein